MKHPEAHEWMALLYGEFGAGERRSLDEHLSVCPDCRKRLERWRATMGVLDWATVPEFAVPRRSFRTAWVRWAIAAILVLGIGITIGRQGTISEREWHRQLGELRNVLRSDVAARWDEDLKRVAEATILTSRAENRAFLEEFLQQYRAAREEDRADLLAALQLLSERYALEAAELRGGLASLASSTGSGFEQARNQMRVLSHQLPVGRSGSDSVMNPNSPE